MIHFPAPWGEATRWIRLVRERWALGDSFPRLLGLWEARFWPIVQLASLCEQSDEFGRSPTNSPESDKFVGLRQNSPESDKSGRSPTKVVGVRQNSPESDKFGRTPTKPRDWLAFAAADVLIQWGTREGYWG